MAQNRQRHLPSTAGEHWSVATKPRNYWAELKHEKPQRHEGSGVQNSILADGALLQVADRSPAKIEFCTPDPSPAGFSLQPGTQPMSLRHRGRGCGDARRQHAGASSPHSPNTAWTRDAGTSATNSTWPTRGQDEPQPAVLDFLVVLHGGQQRRRDPSRAAAPADPAPAAAPVAAR